VRRRCVCVRDDDRVEAEPLGTRAVDQDDAGSGPFGFSFHPLITPLINEPVDEDES
jgi:hypothetical protein